MWMSNDIHKYEWVMAHIWRLHTHVWSPWLMHTNEWVMAQIRRFNTCISVRLLLYRRNGGEPFYFLVAPCSQVHLCMFECVFECVCMFECVFECECMFECVFECVCMFECVFECVCMFECVFECVCMFERHVPFGMSHVTREWVLSYARMNESWHTYGEPYYFLVAPCSQVHMCMFECVFECVCMCLCVCVCVCVLCKYVLVSACAFAVLCV